LSHVFKTVISILGH